MPRTAPTFDRLAPTFVRVGLSFVDANGEPDSASLITTLADATDDNINAWASATANASNANLWEIRMELVTSAIGGSTPSEADDVPRASVKDVLVNTFRNNVTRQTQEGLIPALKDEVLIPETNIPDVTNALFLAFETAVEEILPAAYGSISARFSERKNTNQRVKR